MPTRLPATSLLTTSRTRFASAGRWLLARPAIRPRRAGVIAARLAGDILLGTGLAGLYLVVGALGVAALPPRWSAGGLGHVIDLTAAITVAALFHPLRTVLTARLDRVAYGEHRTASALLASFPKAVLTDPATVGLELVQTVARAVNARWVAVRLHGGLSLAVGAAPDLPDAGDVLTVPLADPHHDAGTLLVGPRTTALPYTDEERSALHQLGRHAAVALHTARLADDQVHLRIREATARSLASERQQALQAVHDHLHQELTTIQAAVTALASDGSDPAPLTRVQQSLGRIAAHLDAMTPFARTGPSEDETAP